MKKLPNLVNKQRSDNGEPVIELRPESDPVSWLALSTIADHYEMVHDEVFDELNKWLYDNPPIRGKVKKLKKWKHLYKDIHFIRRNYLKQMKDDPDWIKQRRKDDPFWEDEKPDDIYANDITKNDS